MIIVASIMAWILILSISTLFGGLMPGSLEARSENDRDAD